MPYVLRIDIAEQTLSETERQECDTDCVPLTQQLEPRRQYLVAQPRYPTLAAVSVRVRGGKALVTDGLFAETHEQLGG